MNQEQVKDTVRWAVTTFGAGFAGFVAGKGWFTADQVMSVITSETFIGLAVASISLISTLFARSQKNAVAVVAAMPDVKAVMTEPTVAGKKLADSIPNPAVLPAGSQQASNAAQGSTPKEI